MLCVDHTEIWRAVSRIDLCLWSRARVIIIIIMLFNIFLVDNVSN